MNRYQYVAGRLLPAVAYGDAVGLPFETQNDQPPNSIRELQPITNPFLEHPEGGELPAGTWSDDTHLTLTVVKSLMEAGGFDLESQAKWHALALDHVEGKKTFVADLVPPIVTDKRNNGWGESTYKSVQALQQGVHPRESGWLSPKSGMGGAGNGVLMKMSGLALYNVASRTHKSVAEDQVVELTEMTHKAPEAVVCSLVHNAYIGRVLTTEMTPVANLGLAYDDARDYERQIGGPKVTGNLLGELLKATNGTGAVSRIPLLSMLTNQETNKVGGFYAPETLVAVYGSLAMNDTFPYSAYRAAELGGDTDSVASIVASISVMRGNEFDEPSDMRQVFAIERLERISREFSSFLGRSSHEFEGGEQ